MARRRAGHSELIEDEAGNLWVQHFQFLISGILPDDAGVSTWSVFEPDGRFLGEVQMPPRFVPKTITSDRVLGIQGDLREVRSIRVYRLIKPAADPAGAD